MFYLTENAAATLKSSRYKKSRTIGQIVRDTAHAVVEEEEEEEEIHYVHTASKGL